MTAGNYHCASRVHCLACVSTSRRACPEGITAATIPEPPRNQRKARVRLRIKGTGKTVGRFIGAVPT